MSYVKRLHITFYLPPHAAFSDTKSYCNNACRLFYQTDKERSIFIYDYNSIASHQSILYFEIAFQSIIKFPMEVSNHAHSINRVFFIAVIL